MKKVVVSAAVLFAVVIAVILVVASTKPDTFQITRSVNINAAPETIYPYMSDFHKGDLWSPYEKKDPAMKRTFSGAEGGKGAVYEFDGNKEVGKGRLEIIEAVPPAKVVLTLDMIEPMQGHNIVEYTLEPKGDGTDVTWAIHGSNTYLGKVMCVFFNMDKMIGKDFEAGLANLKALVERS
jgi:uncharacterized protein YndB with AHSA1/START domain